MLCHLHLQHNRPAGDTRGAGIGTPEAIKLVWSCHREIILDKIIPDGWKQPKAT
jgi:1-pyrroline-5-carboxylate dehydrogenase